MNAKEFDGGLRVRLEALATSNFSDACDRIGIVRSGARS
jgi:hypothetical protein